MNRIFVHLTDSSPVGGVQRYGQVLASYCQEVSSEPLSVREITVPVDSSDGTLAHIPLGAYVFQYSPHFHEQAFFDIVLTLLKRGQERDRKGGYPHRLIVHDAGNLPGQDSTSFVGRLLAGLRHPRSVLPSKSERIRKRFFQQAARLGCRFSVFSEKQRYCLPISARQLTSVVPHFIETPRYDFDPVESKQELGLEGKTVFTILGWINPRKQSELTIEALSHLPQDTYLVLAGAPLPAQPSYGDTLLRMADQLGVGDRVRVTGYLDDAEQARYIAATDVAVCLFRRVSASGSLSTWLAHGKPVVASRLPELEEYETLSPDALFLCADADPVQIAKRLSEVAHSAGDGKHIAGVVALREQLSVGSIWNRIAMG